jgi:hypothetical protein
VATTTAPPAEESLRAPEEPAEPRLALWTGSTFAAVAAVMAWFAVQLGRFVGEAPDMDAMISLRESIVFHRDGLKGLIADRVGTGVHPPLMDTLTSISFAVFGEDPRSQQLIGVALFILLAAATERLLAPYLSAGYRVLAALAVAITPSLAVVLFTVSREAVVLVLLVITLAIALAPGALTHRRLAVLGAVCALFPLTKDACLVLVAPFALYAFFTGGPFADRMRRGLIVVALPLAISILWRLVLKFEGGDAWHTWITSERADEGPFVVAVRAMFGMERGLNLRQNLANALILNWLWVPALLSLTTVVFVWRRGDGARRRAVALIGGLALMFTWTTLTFPTFSVPRYATPLTLLVLLIIFVGLALWPPRARPYVVAALLVTALLGAWSPTDPVSRSLWHTVSIGGERFYDTPWEARGPDRSVYNLAILRASERVNARLRRVFATDVDVVTGDCDSMKFGEKLFSVGFAPSVYDRGIPGARPIKCLHLNELPPDAANGPQKIGLVRTVEEDATNQPPALTGKSVRIIH